MLGFQRQSTCGVRLERVFSAINCISARIPPKGITVPEQGKSTEIISTAELTKTSTDLATNEQTN